MDSGHSPNGLSSGDIAAMGVVGAIVVGDFPFDRESQQGPGIP